MDDHNSCETRRGLIDYHMGKLMSLKLMAGFKIFKSNFFNGNKARFPQKFWPFRELILSGYHSLSTNAHENLNKTVKEFMGLGYLNRPRLLQKMHSFHSKKLVQTYEATEMNRIRKKSVLLYLESQT